MAPEAARKMFELFLEELRNNYKADKVQSGVFQTKMGECRYCLSGSRRSVYLEPRCEWIGFPLKHSEDSRNILWCPAFFAEVNSCGAGPVNILIDTSDICLKRCPLKVGDGKE